jgi:hypothetical protein
LAKDLVQRVVTRGVVETRRLVTLAVLPSAFLGLVLALSGRHWLLWAGVPLLLTSLAMLFVGKLVEHLLDVRYFRDFAKAASVTMPDDSMKRRSLRAYF